MAKNQNSETAPDGAGIQAFSTGPADDAQRADLERLKAELRAELKAELRDELRAELKAPPLAAVPSAASTAQPAAVAKDSPPPYFLVQMEPAQDMTLSDYMDLPVVVAAKDRVEAEDRFREIYGIRSTPHKIVAVAATRKQYENQLQLLRSSDGRRLKRAEVIQRLNA